MGGGLSKEISADLKKMEYVANFLQVGMCDTIIENINNGLESDCASSYSQFRTSGVKYMTTLSVTTLETKPPIRI